MSERHWFGHVAWVGAAAIAGFGISAITSGLLELSRDAVVLVHAAASVSLVSAYVRWSRIDLRRLLRHNLVWGLVGAAIFGTLVALSVQRMDASPRADGSAFVVDLLWLGVVYGLADALLLNVLPVTAVLQAAKRSDAIHGWVGKVVTGALAMIASLIVTTTYHLGFAEYRGSELVDPLFGNGLISLSYLLTANPLTSVIVHIVLHVASAIHGVDATVTLPPHY
jgi:hypothetical protein